jgi:hypothetical protein
MRSSRPARAGAVDVLGCGARCLGLERANWNSRSRFVHGCFDVSVSHQLHQRGQADAGAPYPRRRCVGADADWPIGSWAYGDDGGTGSVIPQVSQDAKEPELFLGSRPGFANPTLP